MHIPHIVYPFFCCWTPGLYFWVILQLTLANKYFWSPPFSSFGYVPRNGIAGSWVILELALCGTTRLFFTVVAPFYTPFSNAWRFQFFYVLTNSYFHFYHGHPSRCEKVSHCSFELHFLMISVAEHIFI